MNKLIPLIFLFLLIPNLVVAEDNTTTTPDTPDIPIVEILPDISILILNNPGLTTFSNTNYTFICEDANTNTLTLIVPQTVGSTRPQISYQLEHSWIGAEYKQIDNQGNVYSYQFMQSGLYRISLIRDYNGSIIQKDFFLEVIGGNGTYASGDVEGIIQKGKWVEQMEFVYDKPWPAFQEWANKAFMFYSNPLYMITDFIIELPFFLLLPQSWFIIGVVVFILLYKLKDRIKTTQKDRQLSQKHGTREDLIRKKRLAEEEQRLHQLNTMPIDYALEKYGSGDYHSRAICYHIGVPEIGVTYPSAYSIAFELGGSYFSTDKVRKERAHEIINYLVAQHEPTLEKAWILQDIAACAKAVSSESVEAKARVIIKDNFMRISELAEKESKLETENISQKLRIKKPDSFSLSSEMKKVEDTIKGGKSKDAKKST